MVKYCFGNVNTPLYSTVKGEENEMMDILRIETSSASLVVVLPKLKSPY